MFLLRPNRHEQMRAPAARSVETLVRARLVRDMAAEDVTYAIMLHAEGKAIDEQLKSAANRLRELETIIAGLIEETRL